MTDEEQQIDAELWAWEAFATAHPYTAYATQPEQFWEFFHAKFPNVSREQMEALLAEADE